MDKIFRIILAVLTLVFFIGLVIGFIWGIINMIPIMNIVFLLLSAGFGFFVYRDYKFFTGNK